MNSLETAIQQALTTQGNSPEANKAYLEFIKANFIIPIESRSADSEPEVLFLEEEGQCFLPLFTDMVYLDAWAREINTQVQLLKLSGVDLLKGIGEQVFVCLNIGSESYKEFNPSEILRMKGIVLKLFSKN
jgi:hypothetical protein